MCDPVYMDSNFVNGIEHLVVKVHERLGPA